MGGGPPGGRAAQVIHPEMTRFPRSISASFILHEGPFSPFLREEEAAREAGRLGEELRKLQREWRDAAAALDAERRRANDAVAAKDAAHTAADDKCVLL